MEGVGLSLFANVYRERRVLVTGHTGFKGSWLTLWLSELGARVTGIARSPDTLPSHWQLLGLRIDDRRQDIRDHDATMRVFDETRPEIVFHLAAQPLVRRSYRQPIETWSTNVMGTMSVLEACRRTASVRAAVIVTTDKCYEDKGRNRPYREIDPLGGHDPYSASKVAAEIATASYRAAYFDNGPLVASARAGNVIGGGDWSEDRLIPDAVRSMVESRKMEVRCPDASRPWQHVLEPLTGYLLLGQRLYEGRLEFAEAWNFGPSEDDNHTVNTVLEALRVEWPQFVWDVSTMVEPGEVSMLQLDSSKARSQLHWRPIWDFTQAIEKTACWYLAFSERGEIDSRKQLESYILTARELRAI